MSPLEKNKGNKEELFNKYLLGDISREEMHLLNQYALEDDFLFEALEGAASYEASNGDAITAIEDRLAKKKSKKRRPLYLYWLGAAASLLLIVFAVNFLNQSANQGLNASIVMDESDRSQRPEPAAEQKLPEGIAKPVPTIIQAPKQAKVVPTIKDQSIVNQEVTLPKTQIEEKSGGGDNELETFVAAKEEEKQSKDLQREADFLAQETIEEAEADDAFIAPKPSAEASSPPPPAKGEAVMDEIVVASEAGRSQGSRFLKRKKKVSSDSDFEEKIAVLSGTVRSIEGEFLAGSNLILNDKLVLGSTDLDGNFQISIPEGEQDIKITAVGYRDTVIRMNQTSATDIVMRPLDLDAIDVVFMYDEKKPVTDSMELLEFEIFANYNLQLPPKAYKEGISGFVLLEFDVNRSGKVGNISVIDSLGYGLDEEAQRLVESYDGWGEKGRFKKLKKKMKLFFRGKQ